MAVNASFDHFCARSAEITHVTLLRRFIQEEKRFCLWERGGGRQSYSRPPVFCFEWTNTEVVFVYIHVRRGAEYVGTGACTG